MKLPVVTKQRVALVSRSSELDVWKVLSQARRARVDAYERPPAAQTSAASLPGQASLGKDGEIPGFLKAEDLHG